MVGARGISAISVPFTAGIALLLIISRYIEIPSVWLSVISAASALAALALVWRIASARNRIASLGAALAFVAGILCCSGSLSEADTARRKSRVHERAELCAEVLKNRIDSTFASDKQVKGLVKALLTSDRKELGRDTKQAFRESGASHILALSGMHLGLLYALLYALLGILGNSPTARAAKAAIIIPTCIFYTIMTGSSPSLVRACIFIVIREATSLLKSRRYSAQNCMQAALIIQLCANPQVLSSPGFQMSYLAVCAILWIYPHLSSIWEGKGLLCRIWKVAALAISCQIMTAPAAWLHFHSLPRHFLLSNILALPLTNIGMMLSVVCLALDSIKICPAILTELCIKDFKVLIFVMETISTM